MRDKMNFKFLILLPAFLYLTTITPLFAESAGEHIDDATIASKAKAALIGDKTVKARKINVEVSKGVLQLSGFVDSEAEEVTALNIANGISGAKEVLDAIIVSPGSRSAGEVLDDTSIAAKLKTKLTAATGLGDATAITTEVKRKHIILAGFVANENVRSKALEVASSIKGVVKVHNLIAVKE